MSALRVYRTLLRMTASVFIVFWTVSWNLLTRVRSNQGVKTHKLSVEWLVDLAIGFPKSAYMHRCSGGQGRTKNRSFYKDSICTMPYTVKHHISVERFLTFPQSPLFAMDDLWHSITGIFVHWSCASLHLQLRRTGNATTHTRAPPVTADHTVNDISNLRIRSPG